MEHFTERIFPTEHTCQKDMDPSKWKSVQASCHSKQMFTKARRSSASNFHLFKVMIPFLIFQESLRRGAKNIS